MRFCEKGSEALAAQPEGSAIRDAVLELIEMENSMCEGVAEVGNVFGGMGRRWA